MRVTVDRDRCSGHVRCAALAPQVYRLDEEGYAAAGAHPVPPGQERPAERGALACPEGAISVSR
ncbi:ferredoxin [Micromonospora pattaloongensis]|uniref:Ferredoxin n=1 Tax=Micromonospora pattaloongensis TaxID=405436 RepID=A0A1H3JCQ9_9ACTN|nr:ferredoxin [Micromonospora pattaloongensis]SDY37627.1 ferredoxin [Micromonospora pattaloongensis]